MPGAPWLLDLFCCAGGAGMGYYRAGFNIVGVDIEPQPHYPFTFVLADALDVLEKLISGDKLGRTFSAIHASPPCQFYSHTQQIRNYAYPDLIGPTRDLILPTGLPYVIENVAGAKDHLRSPVMLCGGMFPELRVYRHRLFESNLPLTVPAHNPHTVKQTKMGRTPVEGEFVHVVGNFCGVEYARKAMGIDWMNRDEMAEALPPRYTEHLGHQIKNHIQKGALHV